MPVPAVSSIHSDPSITGLIPAGFSYASDIKSLGLGQSLPVFVPHAVCISVEIFQAWYSVANTSWSRLRDPTSPQLLQVFGTPSQCSSLASLVFSLSSFHACLKLFQQDLLTPVLELFFPSEKGASQQVTVDQVLKRSSHGQKTQIFSNYTRLGTKHWPDAFLSILFLVTRSTKEITASALVSSTNCPEVLKSLSIALRLLLFYWWWLEQSIIDNSQRVLVDWRVFQWCPLSLPAGRQKTSMWVGSSLHIRPSDPLKKWVFYYNYPFCLLIWILIWIF